MAEIVSQPVCEIDCFVASLLAMTGCDFHAKSKSAKIRACAKPGALPYNKRP
jgi:hypothetical protein